MRLRTSIVGALTALLCRRSTAASAQPRPGRPRLSVEEIAVLRAALAPTRMGFRSKWWVAFVMLITVSACVTVVAFWIWSDRAETRGAAALRTAIALGVSGILTLALVFLIAKATTWRSDVSSVFHIVRRLAWWARVILARAYISLFVVYAGVGLLVLAYQRPEADQRDFEVLAAVGISVTSAGVGVTLVALGLCFQRWQVLRSSVVHHIGLLENGITLSLDAVADLFEHLRVGLGSAGAYAMPVVEPATCDQVLVLYSCTHEAADLLGVLRHAHIRLGRRRRDLATERTARAIGRELAEELRVFTPAQRPGPVQVAAFRLLLDAGPRPIADQCASVAAIWRLVCTAETETRRNHCLEQLDAAFARSRAVKRT